MKKFICLYVLMTALVPALARGAEPPPWAFLVMDKVLPPSNDDGKPKQVLGSAKSYTYAEIESAFNPPDWFPDEHPVMPPIVARGSGTTVRACDGCHLPTGLGHPESANLTGLPQAYFIRQMTDFKSGVRKLSTSMTTIANAITDEDIRQASEYFAALKPTKWTRVEEANSVPKSYVGKGNMRLPLPGGGTEPIGHRIIELPEDVTRATSRDPHSGFVAYVPKGSIDKGKTLVTSGGSGKTLACAICHGADLRGIGDVPRIAGRPAVYLVRQLYMMQSGDRMNSTAELMKAVVANLSQDDMIAIAAYVASREP